MSKNVVSLLSITIVIVVLGLNMEAYGSFIGLYQFDNKMLREVGYYQSRNPKSLSEDWSGKWTGKNGINSLDDFLNNPEVQTKAIIEYHKKIWNSYMKDYHKYEGSEIKGIKLTKSGMLSIAHIFGVEVLKDFINSGGEKNQKDGNGLPCSEYLIGYQGYNLDW